MRVRAKLTFRVPVASKLPSIVGTDERGDVQKKVTQEVFERIKKYMPLKSGSLSGNKTTIESPTKIKVEGPYARRQFFGKKKNGQPYNYNRNRNPLAGPHWDRRLAQNEGRQMFAKIQDYIDWKASR